MKVQIYQCDECGVQKQESNHWVVGFIWPPGSAPISFLPWPDAGPQGNSPNVIHLCGEGCAAKVLSKQIAKWKEK